MSKAIKVSKKHGINPTIPICFWCGKDKNEIVLLGKLPGDVEAPSHMWVPGDYEPCNECAELRNQGITIVEASKNPIYGEGQPPYYGYFPSGRHFIITDDGARRLFTEPMISRLIEKRMGFVDKETMDILSKRIGGEGAEN